MTGQNPPPNDQLRSFSLWYSDGTASGTKVIGEGFNGIEAPSIRGEDLIFGGRNQGGEGLELLLARGAEGVLERLPSIEPGLAGTTLLDTEVVGDLLYISGFRKDVGTELFKIDLSSYPSGLFAD